MHCVQYVAHRESSVGQKEDDDEVGIGAAHTSGTR